MLLLGLDTSTPAVTVALAEIDGGRAEVRAHRTTIDARRHAELVAPMVRDVLAAAGVAPTDVGLVGVGVGPGPYTGLRVGIVTALTFADAVGARAYGVCSLDAIAAVATGKGPVTVVTDARRREVFWATYDERRARTSGPAVGRPADAAALAVGEVVGAGATLYPDTFGPVAHPSHPEAAAICAVVASALAGRGELLPPRPLYLRRPDAVVPGPPKPVLAT